MTSGRATKRRREESLEKGTGSGGKRGKSCRSQETGRAGEVTLLPYKTHHSGRRHAGARPPPSHAVTSHSPLVAVDEWTQAQSSSTAPELWPAIKRRYLEGDERAIKLVDGDDGMAEVPQAGQPEDVAIAILDKCYRKITHCATPAPLHEDGSEEALWALCTTHMEDFIKSVDDICHYDADASAENFDRARSECRQLVDTGIDVVDVAPSREGTPTNQCDVAEAMVGNEAGHSTTHSASLVDDGKARTSMRSLPTRPASAA